MLPLAGKVGLVISTGKKCGVERDDAMMPLRPLPAGVKDRQKGIGREHLAGRTC